MNQLFHLVYLSSATIPFSKSELHEILQKSRVNNEALSVTGLLLYGEGNIIQVLEGTKSDVQALYEKIKKDSRHGGFIKLLEEEIPFRQFGDWSMAFRDLGRDALDQQPGYSDFLSQESAPFLNGSKAQRLLNLFRKNYAPNSPIRGLRAGSQEPSGPPGV